MAPSAASRLNTAFGEDESGESDTRTGFNAMSLSGDAGLALGGSDSLAALAGGPARDGSAPRDEPVRTLTIVGVTPRISPTGIWTERIQPATLGWSRMRCRFAGHAIQVGCASETQPLLEIKFCTRDRAAWRDTQLPSKPFPAAVPAQLLRQTRCKRKASTQVPCKRRFNRR